MRKVPLYLLGTLIAASSGQTVQPFVPNSKPVEVKAVRDIYQKGHNVPEGIYVVKLLDIRCHNTTTYYMKVQIISEMCSKAPYGKQPIINGYARRGSDFSDLGSCFENKITHRRSKDYIGNLGLISLSSTGWIKLVSRAIDTANFPDYPKLNLYNPHSLTDLLS